MAGLGIFDNGQAMQLAGLSVLGGQDVGTAISQGLAQSAAIDRANMVNQQFQQQQQDEARLKASIAQADLNFNDPQGSIARLVQSGATPEQAINIFNVLANTQKERRLEQQQGLMQNLLLGGVGSGQSSASMSGGDGAQQQSGQSVQQPDRSDALMRLGVASGNPALVAYGKQLYDQNKDAMVQKADKEDKDRNLEYKIGTDFNDSSKDFIKARDGFINLRTAANNPSAVSDMQMIYAFMKTQDPGSTVREGEFASAQNTSGVPEKIRAMYNKALTGNFLTPTQRIEFFKLGQQNYDNQLKQQNKNVEEYRRKAEKFGLNPDNVVSDLSVVPNNQPTAQEKSESVNRAISEATKAAALAELKRRGKL